MACCLLLQLHLVFVQPINWDEFRFLADVHSYGRNELSTPLLTFQVHLFGWLTGLGDEIDQIHAARLVMLALESGTLFLIWSISCRLYGNTAALFAALGYVSFSFVFQHGASFRFDPIATFLVMASLGLLLRQRPRWIEMAATGLALALATMITVKVALALPLVIAVGAYRLLAGPAREVLPRLLFAALSSAAFLALLYTWHLSTLAETTSNGAQEHLAASYSKTLVDIPFFPQRNYLLRSFIENPLHWILLLLGLSAVLGNYRKDWRRGLLILAFLLPVLSIAFYRNAFPYFYGFVLAPASILFAAAAGRAELRKLIGPAALILAAGAFIHYQNALSDAAKAQRQVVDAVHQIFPEPVPYIDRCSMIASFPQAGMFLSTMMMEEYTKAGRPMMRNVLRQRQPAFLIANSPALVQALEGREEIGEHGFLPADAALLRDNFVRHWGPIYVAGKSLTVTPSPSRFETFVAGSYTVESRAPLFIDGRLRKAGDLVALEPTAHTIWSAGGNQSVVLRRGTDLKVPSSPEPDARLFGRF